MERADMSSYRVTGVLTPENLEKILPSRERLEKGPVVIVECIQKIPCDPCAHICRFDAIRKDSVVDPPEVDYEKCTGCGECIAACPGLAIFVVNLKHKNDKASVTIPYELLPTPRREEIYEALDREGKPVGEARIIATRKVKDRTVVVTMAVKKHLAMIVRNIGRKLR